MNRFQSALLVGVCVWAGLTVDTAVSAETLRLKSGERLEGRIESEDEWYIKFDTGTRKMRLRKMDIDEIIRPEPEEVDAKFYDGNSIFVDVLLNDSEEANLQVDTGAAYITLAPAFAEKLGVNTKKAKEITSVVADGRESKGYLVQLKSVKIGSIEAKNVDAIIMADQAESKRARPKDGLLGMSFISRYHLRVDYGRKKLIFET